MKVWDRAGIELVTSGSAVRHITHFARWPGLARVMYSQEFEEYVWVNQRSDPWWTQTYTSNSYHPYSVHCSSDFITLLEALSHEFRSGVPWVDLYADDLQDLVIIADSLEEMCQEALIWKEVLRVNAGKTKVIVCPPAEFRRIAIHYLSYRRRQQQHLLQLLQTLGA